MYKGKKVFAFIPARGGSKRVQKKNIRMLHGQPLIYYTIRAAKESALLDSFVLSTEDPEIREIAEDLGCEVWDRKGDQAEDWYSTDMLRNDFYKDVDGHDYLITLHPTSPFREGVDIDNCIRKVIDNDADSVLSVSRIWHLPWQALEIKDGQLHYTFGDKYRFMQSQELPEAYTNAHFIAIWKWGKNEGKELPYVIDDIKGLDIDTELSFLVAEAVMKTQVPDGWDGI